MKIAIVLGIPAAALLLLGCVVIMAEQADAGVLAVGAGGAIRISPDGATWAAQCPAGAGTGCVTVDLYDVHYADSKAVVVGAGGTIMTSPDGIAWTTQCPAGAGSGCITADLHDVTFAAGQWMAVGNAGTVLTSANGSAWTAQTSDTNANLRAVAYGSSQWAAAGAIPDPCLPTCNPETLYVGFSPTGAAWAANDASGDPVWANGLAYGGSMVVGVGTSNSLGYRCGGAAPMTANSGFPCAGNNWSRPCRDVEFATGKFVAACKNYVYHGTNSDPVVWTEYAAPTGFAIEHAGSQWVMVGAAGAAATSPDAMAWTPQSTGSGVDMHGITALPNVRPVNLFDAVTFPGPLTGNAAQATMQDTNRVFNSANSNRIQISDPDGLSAGFYRVTLSTTLGSLALSGSIGLSFSCTLDAPVVGLPACAGSATASSMTFDGTMANINLALDGLTYAPPSGMCGPPAAVITMTTHDEGNFGSGGDLFDTDTITMTLTCPPVNQPPTAACSASLPSPVPAGQAVTFSSSASTDTDGTIVAWEWTFPSGSPDASTTSSQSVTWSGVGSFDVTLKVKDNQNAWSPLVTCNVAVAVFPVAVCNVTSPIPRYAGMAINFASTGSYDPDGTIAEYLWTFPGATPATDSSQNPTATWATPALVAATLRVRDIDNAWSPPDECLFSVLDPGPNDPPQARFSYLPASPTVGELVSFVDESSDPDTWDVITGWQWTFGDGSTSTSKSPARLYGSVGSFPVCLRVTDLSMTPSAPYCRAIAVVPEAAPAPPPGYGAPPQETSGSTTTTSTTSSSTSTQTLPPPPPPVPDTADARIQGAVSVTAGGSGQLDGALSTGSGALSYAWIQLDGERVPMQGGNSATMRFTAPAAAQELRFALIVTSGTATSTATALVQIDEAGTSLAPPAFTVVADGLTVTVTPTTDAASFSWNFGDSEAWEESPGSWSHVYAEEGVKDIRLRLPGSDLESVQQVEVAAEATRPPEPPSASGPVWPYVALAFAVAAILLLGVVLGRPRKSLEHGDPDE